MEIIPNCYKCQRKHGGMYRSQKIKLEGTNYPALVCKQCKIRENVVDIECGTSEIIKNEITCKKCQQCPSLNNNDGICSNCEKVKK